jgi:hypothetical protein
VPSGLAFNLFSLDAYLVQLFQTSCRLVSHAPTRHRSITQTTRRFDPAIAERQALVAPTADTPNCQPARAKNPRIRTAIDTSSQCRYAESARARSCLRVIDHKTGNDAGGLQSVPGASSPR